MFSQLVSVVIAVCCCLGTHLEDLQEQLIRYFSRDAFETDEELVFGSHRSGLLVPRDDPNRDLLVYVVSLFFGVLFGLRLFENEKAHEIEVEERRRRRIAGEHRREEPHVLHTFPPRRRPRVTERVGGGGNGGDEGGGDDGGDGGDGGDGCGGRSRMPRFFVETSGFVRSGKRLVVAGTDARPRQIAIESRAVRVLVGHRRVLDVVGVLRRARAKTPRFFSKTSGSVGKVERHVVAGIGTSPRQLAIESLAVRVLVDHRRFLDVVGVLRRARAKTPRFFSKTSGSVGKVERHVVAGIGTSPRQLAIESLAVRVLVDHRRFLDVVGVLRRAAVLAVLVRQQVRARARARSHGQQQDESFGPASL